MTYFRLELQRDPTGNPITPGHVRKFLEKVNRLNTLLVLYNDQQSLEHLQTQRDRLEDMLAAMGLDAKG